MKDQVRDFQIDIGVAPRATTVLHRVLTAVSLTFLIGTVVLLQRFMERGYDLQLNPFVLQVLAQSNLAAENVLAAWYSSTLLLATAVACLVCFLIERWPRPASAMRFGWIGLAVIFAMLSWDEMGSLHEREELPTGTLGWLLWFTPFILAVPGYMLFFAWFHLRRSKRAFAYACIGVLLFVTVPVQEFIEVELMLANGGPEWRRPVIFVVLEEGAELIAMQFFLAGVIRYALDVLGNLREQRVVLTVTFPARQVMSALFVAVLGLSLIATYELERLLPSRPGDGRPEIWWPSALAFVACVMTLPSIPRARRGRERITYLLLAVMSLLVGAYVGGTVVYDPVRVVLVGGILLTTTLAFSSLSSPGVHLGSAAWGVSALIAIAVSDLLVTRLLLCVAAGCLISGLYAGTGPVLESPSSRPSTHPAARSSRAPSPRPVRSSGDTEVLDVVSLARRPWPRS